MTATRRRQAKTLGEYSWILEDGDEAIQGEAAGLDTATATVRPMGSSATMIKLGHFAEALTGDGETKVRVSLDEELAAEWYANDDSPNDVDATSLGSECYAVDGRTVSTLSTSRSVMGRVLDYDAVGNRVLVGAGVSGTGATGAGSIFGFVADRTALKAIGSTSRVDGQTVLVKSDGSLWRFVAASSVATDVAEELVAIPAVGTGRWIRADKVFVARIPVAAAMADGDKILTVPAGYNLRLTGRGYWEITTGFTGGTSSGLGVASDHSGYATAGDILGGANGELTAVIGTAGVKAATIGPKMDTEAEVQAFNLLAGESLTYEEITDAYTAGAGFACLEVIFSPIGV